MKQLKMYSRIQIQYEKGSDSTELQIYILISKKKDIKIIPEQMVNGMLFSP